MVRPLEYEDRPRAADLGHHPLQARVALEDAGPEQKPERPMVGDELVLVVDPVGAWGLSVVEVLGDAHVTVQRHLQVLTGGPHGLVPRMV